MYWKGDEDDEEKLLRHIVNEMDEASLDPSRVVSSSNSVPSSNKSGDNPPLAKSRTQYETIVDSFLCTMVQQDPIRV